MDNNSFAVGYVLGWKRGSDSGGGSYYDDVYHDILTNSRQVYSFSEGIYSFGLNLWTTERTDLSQGAVWDQNPYGEDTQSGAAIAAHFATDRRFNFHWVAVIYKNNAPQYACLLMTSIYSVSGSGWWNNTKRIEYAMNMYYTADGVQRAFTYRQKERCYDLHEFEVTTAFTSNISVVTANDGRVSLTGRVDINYPVRAYSYSLDASGIPIVSRDTASDSVCRGYTLFTANNYVYNIRPNFYGTYSDMTAAQVQKVYSDMTAYILERRNGIPTDANSTDYLFTPSDADYHFPLT